MALMGSFLQSLVEAFLWLDFLLLQIQQLLQDLLAQIWVLRFPVLAGRLWNLLAEVLEQLNDLLEVFLLDGNWLLFGVEHNMLFEELF